MLTSEDSPVETHCWKDLKPSTLGLDSSGHKMLTDIKENAYYNNYMKCTIWLETRTNVCYDPHTEFSMVI